MQDTGDARYDSCQMFIIHPVQHLSAQFALFGGSFSLFSTHTLCKDALGRVLFSKCTSESNSAQYGSAIAILPNAWNIRAQGSLPEPIFIDCTIESNKVQNIELPRASNQGAGALYCFRHRLTFKRRNRFFTIMVHLYT